MISTPSKRVKHFLQDRSLVTAVAVSALAHAVLLAVHFAPPEPFRFKPVDPGLEVILVNARHDRKPVKAEALAQANLDGGGNADAGRAKSPLPDLKKTDDGDSIRAARRRVAELEERQRVLAQTAKKTPAAVPKQSEQDKPSPAPPTPAVANDSENTRELARREAEINRQIEDYNKRPRKTQITPSTREVGYAMYYAALQKRIENIGTMNFPQQNGKKLYGELVVYIPVFQDGTLYDREGGPRVEKSSGNAALDAAALRIVRRAAPFGRFPENMRSTGKDDVWEIITRFKFTRDDAVQTELRGGSN
jgi:periplasmic protein TonB